jgi:hypothetical protein
VTPIFHFSISTLNPPTPSKSLATCFALAGFHIGKYDIVPVIEVTICAIYFLKKIRLTFNEAQIAFSPLHKPEKHLAH